jgi:hypothetical protein
MIVEAVKATKYTGPDGKDKYPVSQVSPKKSYSFDLSRKKRSSVEKDRTRYFSLYL